MKKIKGGAMEEIAKVKEVIENLESKANEVIADYEAKLSDAREREAAALEAAEKAYKSAKVDLYHKCQEEVRLNQDAAKMYESKLMALKSEKLISKDDFENYFKVICEDLNTMVESDLKRIAELVSEMIEIQKKERDIISDTNIFIKHMQKDILKDIPGCINNYGQFVEYPQQYKKFKDYKVCEFVRLIRTHPTLKGLVEEEPRKGLWIR